MKIPGGPIGARPLARRRVLQGAIAAPVLGATAVALAACGSDEPPPAAVDVAPSPTVEKSEALLDELALVGAYEGALAVYPELRGSLAGLSGEQLGGLVVAYEPIWAIGTGVTASAEDAQEMCAHVRKVIGDMKSGADADVRIQYGGSVKATNAKELLGKLDIDGALVGGAALDPVGFARIARFDQD